MKKKLFTVMLTVLFAATCLSTLGVGISSVTAYAASAGRLTVSNSLKADPEEGYVGPQSVTLTANNEEATVYYTLDGSVPTVESAALENGGGTFRIGTDGEAERIALRYFAKLGSRTTSVYTDIYAINTETVKIDENIAFGKPNSAVLSVPSSSSYDTWYGMQVGSDAAGNGDMPIANMTAAGNNKLTDGDFDVRYGLWRNAEAHGRLMYTLDLGEGAKFNQLKLYNYFSGAQHARYADFAFVKIWAGNEEQTTVDGVETNMTLVYDYEKAGEDETMFSERNSRGQWLQSETFGFGEQTARFITFEFYSYYRDSSAYLYSMASEAEVYYCPAMPETPDYDPLDDMYDELEINSVSAAVGESLSQITINMSHDFYNEAALSDIQSFSSYTIVHSSASHGGADHTPHVNALNEQGAADAVDRLIEFDGKTFWEMRNDVFEDVAKEYGLGNIAVKAGGEIAFGSSVMVGNAGKSLTVHFTNVFNLPIDNLAENVKFNSRYAFTDLDSPHTLTIKKGFVTGGFARLKKDVTFTYDPATKNWTSDSVTDDSEYETLDASGVTGPVVSHAEDNNVSFFLTLSDKFYSTDLNYVGCPDHFINANIDSGNAGFEGWTKEIVNSFTSEGVLSSMESFLLINGKSIKSYRSEWQELSLQVLAISVHAKGNQLEIMVPGKINGTESTYAITDLNQPFTIELKRGFLSGNLAMVKSDIKFTYNPETKSWTREGNSSSGTAGTETKFIGYNGFAVTEGCVIETVSAGELKKADFTVQLVDSMAVWSIEEKTLETGDNAVKLTITGSDGSTREINFTIRVLAKPVQAEKEEGGCGSALSGAGAAFTAACLALMAAFTLLAAKKQKNLR